MIEKPFFKDPDAILDYAFDWTDWLTTDEIITSHTVTAEAGITKDSDSEASGIVTVWLSGGTVNIDYTIACKITTNNGRTEERSILIMCRQR